MGFSRGGRRIGTASTSSTSARPFPTKRGSRSARRFEAGICIYAVTRQSKICRGCSIQRSEAGCNTTGGIIARRYIRTCVNWTVRWPIGRTGNTKSCAVIYGGRPIGLRVFRGVIRSCSHTGRWACGVAPWWEPYELRGSSTVLREARGETPRAYSPRHRVPTWGRSGTIPGATAGTHARVRVGATSGEDAPDTVRAICHRTSTAEWGREAGNLQLSGFHAHLRKYPQDGAIHGDAEDYRQAPGSEAEDHQGRAAQAHARAHSGHRRMAAGSGAGLLQLPCSAGELFPVAVVSARCHSQLVAGCAAEGATRPSSRSV